ncbi:MAG: hypothetical protein KA740_04985 [Rhodoferax sp.]|nr:hypothetical protein [Rhodoferax sp.]
MMSIFRPALLRFAVACALASGLVACGGGGGTSPNVTVATYVPGAAESGALGVLLNARASCGFNGTNPSVQFTRNAKLDAASLAHAKYLVDWSFATGISQIQHEEDPLIAGFTGIDLSDRGLHQKYSYGALAEILEATSWDYQSQQTFATMETRGANSMRNLLNTVYHLSGAMFEGNEVGVGAYMKTASITSTTWREEYRFGALIGYNDSYFSPPIVLGAGKIATYPCNGMTGIPTSFAPAFESPNPFPSYSSVQLVGPPIYLKVDASHTLTIGSYSITQNNTAIPAVLLTTANDPNTYPNSVPPRKYIEPNEAFLVPSIPLTAGKDYTVKITGTIDAGTANSVGFVLPSFTFSTGS